jgi:Fe-S cluster assembly protein SufB
MSQTEIDLPLSEARQEQARVAQDLSEYRFGWSDSDEGYAFTSGRGLTRESVAAISDRKQEPAWMRDLRLRAFAAYERRPMPNWGADLSDIMFDEIFYYVEASEGQATSWDALPPEILETYEKLGIPQAERERLIAGVAAQYESTVLYHKVREDLEEQGVIFLDTDSGLQEHEDLFREHFATVIPPNDNKFAALNTAVWSGGSFIVIPEGVKVDIPLQAYFRINKQNMGQFERTLIIAEPGSYVHYVEGCTAPIYSSDSLHSAVVEIIVKEGARVRYTTIQNWSNNVYNLVTKRAVAEKNATMEWIDGNIGSKVTMKYPAVWLTGEGAKGEVLSVAYANDGQHQDAGAKMVHAAPYTTSNILSKSISKGSGRTSYRGLVAINDGAHHSRSAVKCDALMLDETSRTDTYPYMEIDQDDATIEHEATVSKLSEDQLFYMQSRGHRGGRGHRDDRARLHRADRPRAADGVRRRAQPPDRPGDGGCDRLIVPGRVRATRRRKPGGARVPARRRPRRERPVTPAPPASAGVRDQRRETRDPRASHRGPADGPQRRRCRAHLAA